MWGPKIVYDKQHFQYMSIEQLAAETGESYPLAMAHLAFLHAFFDRNVPPENAQRLLRLWDIATRAEKGEITAEQARDELSHG